MEFYDEFDIEWLKGEINMKIQGIKRGKTIELLQSLDIPDGTEITFEIEPMNLMSDEERQKKIKEFFQIPQEDREELVAILTELDKERHSQDLRSKP